MMQQEHTLLQIRSHPQALLKLQYRYQDNQGHWRWGPSSARRAPYDEVCPQCGGERIFIQQGSGEVYRLCTVCGKQEILWWPARANEIKRDGNAAWRRAVRKAAMT